MVLDGTAGTGKVLGGYWEVVGLQGGLDAALSWHSAALWHLTLGGGWEGSDMKAAPASVGGACGPGWVDEWVAGWGKGSQGRAAAPCQASALSASRPPFVPALPPCRPLHNSLAPPAAAASRRHCPQEIASALKGAQKLVLATDPDREGEAIAWHLLQELQARPHPPLCWFFSPSVFIGRESFHGMLRRRSPQSAEGRAQGAIRHAAHAVHAALRHVALASRCARCALLCCAALRRRAAR